MGIGQEIMDELMLQQQLWNDIKDRKGKMVNDKFIKEADLSK